MLTGFYTLANGDGEEATVLLEDDAALQSLFNDPYSFLISPVTYIHGACDIFALHLAQAYGYSIRAYLAKCRDGRPMLVHAVCFAEYGNGVQWIDIRGITDDGDEMLAPFEEDMASYTRDGYDLYFEDFVGNEGIVRFEEDVVGSARNADAYADEIWALLSDAKDGMF